MLFIVKQPKQRPSQEEWHWKFAWLPTRINDVTIVWLERYQRRMRVVAEGNWAGGFQYRWEYASARGEWAGPVIRD